MKRATHLKFSCPLDMSLLLTLLVFVSGALFAQSPAASDSITVFGKVYSGVGGEPFNNATIIAEQYPYTSSGLSFDTLKTGNDGSWSIRLERGKSYGLRTKAMDCRESQFTVIWQQHMPGKTELEKDIYLGCQF